MKTRGGPQEEPVTTSEEEEEEEEDENAEPEEKEEEREKEKGKEMRNEVRFRNLSRSHGGGEEGRQGAA